MDLEKGSGLFLFKEVKMATAREKNGRWYYRITISSKGKRRYLERGSFATRKEALDAGNEHESKIKRGDDMFTPVRITYGDMAYEWLTTYAPTLYKPNTINTHKKTLRNYILPVLKDYEVSAINTKDLQEIINKETPNHTRYGLDKIHSTLVKTFDYGIIAGYIAKTPLEGLVMPLKRSIMAQSIKPSRTQKSCEKRLLNAIWGRFPEGHPCYIPLLLGYRCGLRLGEAYGVLIDDIDRKGHKLYVRRQIQFNDETNELYFTALKYCNPGEYRTIDLDGDTWRILMRHITRIESSRTVMQHKQYFVSDNGIVNETKGKSIYFLNVRLADGSYISPRTMQHVSRVIHGKEGIFNCVDPSWDFHMLRHTHASECIAAGMPPESVQKRLGHKRLDTTYRFYVHETEEENEKAKEVLEVMFK